MGLKHQAATNRKLRAAMRQAETHLPSDLPPLIFLTDPARTPDPVSIARALPSGSAVILRHFGNADQIALAGPLASVCRAKHHIFLIANDPHLAWQVGADGVHWPEAHIGAARHWRGRFAIQTASAHSRRAIWRAQKAGMDAALVSAVFTSNSPSAGPAMGAARFRVLAWQSALPLYALGGVNAATAGRIGAFGGLAAVESLEGSFHR